ncbi:TlpA family protein disulfide reductase [Marinilabiliaceae bacterium JC017]|nr:TlpA family protein disulfide reductase [Marinilabiliaceae bacterium JC017]
MKQNLLFTGLLICITSFTFNLVYAQDCSSMMNSTSFKNEHGDTISADLYYLDYFTGVSTQLELKTNKEWREYRKNKKKGNTGYDLHRLIPITDKERETHLEASKSNILTSHNIGKEFPGFQVTDLNGNNYNTEELKGKIVVLNFWFIQCLPCQLEVSALNNLYEKYKDNPEVVFISFARNSPEDLKTHLEKKEFTYPTVYFNDNLSQKIKVKTYPSNIVIDKSGKYAFESIGVDFGSVLLLDRAIKSALQ